MFIRTFLFLFYFLLLVIKSIAVIHYDIIGFFLCSIYGLQDDILPKLMTSTSSYEDLFRKEISKYDRISEDIAHNIEAQEQLLLQIQV